MSTTEIEAPKGDASATPQPQYPPPQPEYRPQQGYPPQPPGYAGYPPQQGGYPPPGPQQPPMPYGGTASVATGAGSAAMRRGADLHNAEAGSNSDDGEAFTKFSDKSVRLAFVRKVFVILAVMLLVTAGIMAIFMFVEEVNEYVQNNNWVYITSVCVYMTAVIALACAGDLRRKVPLNFVFLGIVTVAMGCMLGTIATYFETKEILIAVGIVMIVTLGMVGLGFQNKVDFTAKAGFIVVLTMCLFGFGLMALIFRSNILYIFYASLGALLFSIWIVIDVQMMLGGTHKFAISPEEYVVAALNIYLDIVNLLLYILMIIKGTQ